MCLEKVYFTLSSKTKLSEKEVLKLYIVLLRAELTCTIKSSLIGRAAIASYVVVCKSNVGFQKLFFLWLCLHSKSKIYFFQEYIFLLVLRQWLRYVEEVLETLLQILRV